MRNTAVEPIAACHCVGLRLQRHLILVEMDRLREVSFWLLGQPCTRPQRLRVDQPQGIQDCAKRCTYGLDD
jgi:hypothetical protein